MPISKLCLCDTVFECNIKTTNEWNSIIVDCEGKDIDEFVREFELQSRMWGMSGNLNRFYDCLLSMPELEKSKIVFSNVCKSNSIKEILNIIQFITLAIIEGRSHNRVFVFAAN